MRVDRVCVRRLKTFEYYGNVSVELCATVDEGDRLDDVVSWLQVKAEAYAERQREVTKLEEYVEAVERLLHDVSNLMEQVNEAKKALEREWRELSSLLGELNDARSDVEKAKSIIERLREKLRGTSRG